MTRREDRARRRENPRTTGALAPVSAVALEYWRARRTVIGAFWDIDFLLFDALLHWQQRSAVRGDLLEIGALYGKSAIVLGLHARPDETVAVCDIFEAGGADSANELENEASYPGLTRSAFESNYRRWVPRDPTVIQARSDSIRQHLPEGSLRFAHVDGGHHFDIVRTDLESTRPLMTPGGVVVLDDFRALHTPGVAAAAWASVVGDGLIPICLSEQKMYATWDPEAASSSLALLNDWARQRPQVDAGLQDVAGHTVVVIANPRVGRSLRSRLGRWVPPAVRELGRPRPLPYLGQPL